MLRDRESGQSIIIIVGALLVLLALVALVVDVGNAYAHRRMVQNAVDAAALAGARRLADSFVDADVIEIDIWDTIQAYAELNGLNPEDIDAWFIDADDDETTPQPIGQRYDVPPSWADGVKVEGDLPFTTYLAQLLGFRSMTATTTAKAWVLFSPCSAFNLFPITVSTSTFTETTGVPKIGHVYTLWNEKLGPGSWGFLTWQDGSEDCLCKSIEGCCRAPYDAACPQLPSASNLKSNIADNTRSGNWAVGDWVCATTGREIGSAFDYLYPYVTGDPWPEVIIPLYDEKVKTGSNTRYRIGAFAAFRLRCAFSNKAHYAERVVGDCDECSTDSPSNKCIRGEFVRTVIPSADDGCVDTGIFIPSFRKPQR